MERLPGFRDFYPEPVPHAEAWSAAARSYLFERWRAVAHRYGFREYDGPPLEPLELYTLKSGDEIVRQLYNFTDKGGRAVALRPEMTPTLARMVAAHHRNYKKPLKWFAIPQLFRYERQQKGRLREHFQFNADIIGESGPGAEAELLALLIDSLRAVGLTAQDVVVRLSSRQVWTDFYARHGGDPTRAYEFYQAVDKLDREPREQIEAKLAALGLSLAQVEAFIQEGQPTPELQAIIRDLAARGLAEFVQVDYRIIRGLAYYTGVVFEVFDREGQFRAVAGGGRYDNLIKLISGGRVDLPALGFGMGDVVLLELLQARGLLPAWEPGLQVFCLIEDEALRERTLQLVQQLRTAGCTVDYPLSPLKPDKQFKRALESGASYTAKVEPSDGADSKVRVRDLKSRTEQLLSMPEAVRLLSAGRPGPG
jgi:histidyl-tRNA synthetase